MVREALTSYTIAVKTSDKFAAGTDANVFIQLMGPKKRGEPLALKDSLNHFNKFERNQSDVLFFHVRPTVGHIEAVSVWHDDRGPWPGWHLHEIHVHDSATNCQYHFPCDRWLVKDEDDGATRRLLRCEKKKFKSPKIFNNSRDS